MKLTMNLISIPALKDNYIWLLHNSYNQCLIVDPGEATPVLKIISKNRLTPIAILLTHYHRDHVGGLNELLCHFHIPIYGPKKKYIYDTYHIARSCKMIQVVHEGDSLMLLDNAFHVVELPGHTLDHIGFYCAPWLFSGDTIFSGGCGRILQGTPKQMYNSLQKINQLPLDTLICAAHEYTLDNLKFARTLFPKNSVIEEFQQKLENFRLKNQPSLPTTLYLERQINLFLRCHEVDLQKKLNFNVSSNEEWRVFSVLRDMKDNFLKF